MLLQYNCVVVKWHSGIMEGYGQWVQTVVSGCEGGTVSRGWTELYNDVLIYCSPHTELDKRGRECRIHDWRNYDGKTVVVKFERKSLCGRRSC